MTEAVQSELDRAAVDVRHAAPMMKRAARASLAVAAFLVALKLAAGVYTGSVSLLSSLVDSALDLMASAVNLIAIAHAVAPADRQHRFGHGQAAAIGRLAQPPLLVASAHFVPSEAKPGP